MKKVKLNKKKKRIIATVVIVFLVLAIPAASVSLLINNYLSKINYVDPDESTTLKIDPTFSHDDFGTADMSEANSAIKENVSDKRFWYNENVINILLIGFDYGSSDQYYGRSDAMIIASINKRDKTISYVSLSRATYVSIPGHKNTRLNAAYSYGGPELLIKTIESNYKTRIDNYIAVDFEGFQKIIDVLGGVDITLTQAEIDYLKPIMLQKEIDISGGAGQYKLDGDLALRYARIRSIDTDRARTQRQRNLMKQLTYKARSISVSSGIKVLDTVLPLVTTDFSKRELVSQATNATKYVSWSIEEALIPKIGPPLKNINGLEVLILDWDIVRNDIHEQLYPNMEPVESATKSAKQ